MPRSSNDQVPKEYVSSGIWPRAELRVDAPASAHYSQALARNLEAALHASGHSLRTLADEAGLTHTTIGRVLRGEVLPDLGTLARLEVVFDIELWPGLASLPQRTTQSGESAIG
ncbi:helix-turn-helix domain-containing protein [Kitasatospora cineracea]|uniref:helix-turn-helix domain-containing protein n=1 Tax=Kitasatospora cineracea TaxID=88074 RepID=UPI00378CEE0C